MTVPRLSWAVEIGTADPDAVIGEDVVAALRLAAPLGADAHDREVRGAAADIRDQRDLLAIHLPLIVERRRDRFILERDLAEADLAGDRAEHLLRLAIAGRVVIDEMHRSPMHDGVQLHVGERLCAALHDGDEMGDDRAEADTAAADLRRLVDQRIAEHGFEAAHQPPVLAVDIGADRRPSDARRGLLGIEDGARQRHGFAFERDERRLGGGEPERRVGRAEIEAAGSHGAAPVGAD